MPKGGKREGSGRKPSVYPRIKAQYKVDEDLVEWLQQESQDSGVTMSDLVCQALQGLRAIKGYSGNISQKSVDKID